MATSRPGWPWISTLPVLRKLTGEPLNSSVIDAYFKKTVGLRIFDRDLEFRVSQELFSSDVVDAGTKLLLKSLAVKAQKILDLGCGYGVLGVALAAADESRDIHLVDRDALAVEY